MNSRRLAVVIALAISLTLGMAAGVSPAYAHSTASRLKTLESRVNTLRKQIVSVYQRLLALESRPVVAGPKGDKGDPGEDADPTEFEAMRTEIAALKARVNSLEETATTLQSWRAGMPKRIATGIVTSTANIARTEIPVPDATGAEIVQVTQLNTHNGIWHYARWTVDSGKWSVNSGSNITGSPISIPIQFMWVAIYP